MKGTKPVTIPHERRAFFGKALVIKMSYKKFNLYEGVKISERVLSAVIVLGLVALAVTIIAFAKPHATEENLDTELRLMAENKGYRIPTNQENTVNLIK